MKLHINDKTYAIYFKHVPNETGFTVEDVPYLGRTYCAIDEIMEGGTPVPISTGTSFCSLKDQFNKETGRRVSLTRALGTNDFIFNYQERAYIWQWYLNRKNAHATKRIEVAATRREQRQRTATA